VSTAEEHERPGTVLRGRALPAARAAWVALVATVLALFVTGIPASYRTARVLRPETVAGLEHLGVPTGLPAAYLTILDTVTMLGFAGIAVLIFARRSDDWIAMLMALTLVLTAMLYTAPAFEAPAPVLLVAMLCALGEICQLAVIYLFPSGRFVPRWIWILLVPLVVWRPAIWTLSYIPGYLASERTGERYAYVSQDPRDIGLMLALFAVGFVTQVYRYRHVSSPMQRQQTKWLLFGMLGTVAITGGYILLTIATMGASPPLGSEALLARLGGRTVRQLALFLVPVTVTYSILRYRLWDIDRLINRALVYGLLTAGITVIYLAIVVGVGTLIGSRSRPNLFLSIVATALIAVAFQPARDRSRRVANRLVYGKRATPYEVLSDFSRGMAGASTDDSLLRMARLVVEATGAVQAIVWLRLGDVLQPHGRWPQTGPLPQPVTLEGGGVEQALAVTETRSRSFPVEHEEELLGALTVIVSPAEPLTPAGEKLIADLAARTGLGLRFERMKERALFARALASFLPPEVAELVEASPSALSLREELEATILFSDIRGFSSLAERLPPREVAEVVGRHLAAMVEVVTSQGGVLDKFAGDAVMAVFGAPRPAEDHAQRALGCAVAMQRRQLALNDAAGHEGLPVFQIGIGVNTGTVIAGTLGGVGRLDYTVLGDAVNVAQRLQSEAMGGEILASAVTVRQSGTDRAEAVGLKQLKGRQELVEAYRIRWADTSTEQALGETAYAE